MGQISLSTLLFCKLVKYILQTNIENVKIASSELSNFNRASKTVNPMTVKWWQPRTCLKECSWHNHSQRSAQYAWIGRGSNLNLQSILVSLKMCPFDSKLTKTVGTILMLLSSPRQSGAKEEQKWRNDGLMLHNHYRQIHGVPPLELDEKVSLIKPKWKHG